MEELENQIADLETELALTNKRLTEEIASRRRAEARLLESSPTLEQTTAELIRELNVSFKLSLIAGQAGSMQTLLDEALVQVMTTQHFHTAILLFFDDLADLTKLAEAHVYARCSELPDMPHQKGGWFVKAPIFAELVERSEPLLIPDISCDARLPEAMRCNAAQMLLLAPWVIEGETLGVVGLMRPSGPAPDIAAINLLTYIIIQIGYAVKSLELRKLDQEVKLLAERERLGRDLHDSVTQSLYGLFALAEAGQARLEAGNTQGAFHSLERIAQTTQKALQEMRLFIHELRPNLLEEEGLVGALQLRLAAVEGRTGTRFRLLADENLHLPVDVEDGLYRIAIEALNNIMRHSQASNVTVSLQKKRNQVILQVTDDGRGFDPERIPDGRMGLDNIRTYAHEIGACLQISSALAQGTVITVEVAGEGRT